jgi:protein TonB
MLRTKLISKLGLSLLLLAVASMPAGVAQRIRIGGNVQAANLVHQVVPVYPPEAKRDRIQGVVRLEVEIGADGNIQSAQVVSGPSELVAAARTAVLQWVYRPTLPNGEPVEVLTTVDVNFTLSQ